MLLDNPVHVRTAASIAKMSDEQVYRLYHRMVRELESQNQRDVDLLRSLIRSLTEQRGQCKPLVAELCELFKAILEGRFDD